MAEKGRRVIAAACDGACSGNPGPGGWGALLRFEDGSVRELGGAEPDTTNNRMELSAALAVLEALRDLPRHPDLRLRTDSRYLIDGLQKWLPGWKRKGWRTASGSPVLNRDLWERLERARLADVPLVHVRGHSGDPDNERCDVIAVAFSRGQLPQLAAGEVVQQARGVAERPAPAAAAAASGFAAASAAASGSTTASGSTAVPGSTAVATDVAPRPLLELLSRLELAERLAGGGYSLTLLELAQLVEMPLRQLEQRHDPWTWRDWRVLPQGRGRWRLERDAGGLETRQ